jgi:DNA-directed RNA polymerase subunit RPC12/RpoP/anti-anti-sigma regulatory factor
MIHVTREEKSGALHIRISGTIDEHVDLSKEIGELPAKVVINCREISQINSLGVKGWIEFFSRSVAGGLELSLAECPPPIVEQLNYITNFSCGAQVVSVSVPFTCEKCHKELRGVVKAEDLKKVAYKLPPIKCPKCNSKAHFDDVPEEYFAFLIRQFAGTAG